MENKNKTLEELILNNIDIIKKILYGSYTTLYIQFRDLIDETAEKKLSMEIFEFSKSKTGYFCEKIQELNSQYPGPDPATYTKHVNKACYAFIDLVLTNEESIIEEVDSFEDLCFKLVTLFISKIVSESKIFLVANAMKELTERENYVLKNYFGFNTKQISLKEIGENIALGLQTVKNIKHTALARLCIKLEKPRAYLAIK